jgi:lambda family phage portal protein
MSQSLLVDQYSRPMEAAVATSPSSYYNGTQRTRHRSNRSSFVSDSRTTLNKAARQTLVGFARTLYENYGEVKGAIDDVTRYSVGAGIRPQSLAGDVATEYEQFFNEWAKNADLAGQFSFWGLQRLASLRLDIDGDIGFNMVRGGNDWPFLQPIEAHRISGDKQDKTQFDGVSISPKTGRPVAYHVRQDKDSKRIPARDFILISDPKRVNQYRGITSLSHAISDVWDIADILDYEKVGVKMRSAIGMVMVTKGGTTDDALDIVESGYAAADTGTVPWQTFDAGMIPRLQEGEDISEFGGNQPSPAFQGFIELLMRKTAVGLGLPFEFVWNPTDAGGATQRAVLAKAQRKFNERGNLLDEKFNKRVWGWVISKAIKRGDLPHSADWWRVRWQHPKKITVDVGREAKESREDIKMGLKTLADDAGERGLDWQEIRTQTEAENIDLIQRAKHISETQGIDLNMALSLMSQRTPNPPTEANDSPAA